METQSPTYVFRGTTLGFKGNATSNRIPVTCTTANPCKASVFALSASYEYKVKGIVYIAETFHLKSIAKLKGNCFENYEEEIGFSLAPGQFQNMCIGYVSVEIMQKALSVFEINYNSAVNPQNLSDSLAEMRSMSSEEIEQLVKIIRAQIEKD